MSLSHLSTALEIKQVSEQRIISGHAAAWALDRVGDVIDQKAFNKTLVEKAPADVAVFIGHNSSALPVGIPLVIRPDEKGLYTEVRVFDGPAGDNLLAVARGLKAHGQTLGLSIGYQVRDSKMERTGSQMVRRLLDIDLVEFSYAAKQSIANPAALMTSVKANGDGAKQGAIGSFDYTRRLLMLQLQEMYPDKWCRIEDVYPDRLVYSCSGSGDAPGTYWQAPYSSADDGGLTIGTPVQVAPDWQEVPSAGDEDDAMDKTLPLQREVTPVNPNLLLDSAFLFIEPGGQLDDERKTVPRSLRHFPIRDAEGKLDSSAIRTALVQIPQAEVLDAETKTRLQAVMRRGMEAIAEGKTESNIETPEWKAGAAIDVRSIAYRLLDASETIAAEFQAMALLGGDTKANGRLRHELRQKLADLAGELGRLVRHAELIDAEQDGAAQVALNRSRLQLLEV